MTATTHAAKRAATRSPAKSARRPSAKAPSSDAIEFLSAQHREVEALFKRFEKLGEDGPADEKEMIVRTACEKLTVHATIEEEIFYPAARDVRDADSLLNEAEVEHGSVKELIEKLDAMEGDDHMFDAHFTVLSEFVKHHVKEEEDELFPKVRKSELDLEDLGQQLAARAEELAGSEETEAA